MNLNEQQQANMGANPKLSMKITPDMVRNSKSVTCECGGMVFTEKVFFKVLSPLISPSGKEELVPMPIFVCEKCGKVPGFFDSQNILPEEIKAVAPKTLLSEGSITATPGTSHLTVVK